MSFVRVKNGNYIMAIDLATGTKIRFNDLDNLTPDYPESMDVKITNKCDMGCAFCHENSLPDGKHADIMNAKFIETLLPYTELALGGGNPLEHPDLVPFLKKCRQYRLIPNMTVNQVHFMKNYSFIKKLIDDHLIFGLGISLTNPSEEGFIENVKSIPTAVIHIINGVQNIESIKKLYNQNLKVLILGYKDFRRGVEFHSRAVEAMKEKYKRELPTILKSFKAVAFDNLALEQLNVKAIVDEKTWEEQFMGDEGQYTFYVDLVNKQFARNSTSPLDQRYDLLADAKEMFDRIRK